MTHSFVIQELTIYFGGNHINVIKISTMVTLSMAQVFMEGSLFSCLTTSLL